MSDATAFFRDASKKVRDQRTRLLRVWMNVTNALEKGSPTPTRASIELLSPMGWDFLHTIEPASLSNRTLSLETAPIEHMTQPNRLKA